jgi:phosphate:Na+ symporter
MQVNTLKELIFGIIGGTALLIYGVEMMGEGLEKAAGKLIKKVLSLLTGRLWSAFLTGTVATALVQSSTAVTVLTVGFVNAELMGLKQAVGVIFGANIGTTITAQLMAFNLTDIALPALGAGFMIMYLTKNETVKNAGRSIMGFGMLFLGLRLLNSGVPYLKSNEVVIGFFMNYGDNLPVSVLMGTLATMAVHSSSASVGITMILAQSGLIGIDGAIGLMLGGNIGTSITAQAASITGSISARRTAWAHTIYNIAGAVIALMVIKPFIMLIQYTSPGLPIERQIANSHTIFNILSAALFLPVTGYYVRFLEYMVPEKKRK